MHEQAPRRKFLKPNMFIGAGLLAAALYAPPAEGQNASQTNREFFTFGKATANVSNSKGTVEIDPRSVRPTIDEVIGTIQNAYAPLPVPLPENIVSDAQENLASQIATLNQSGSWTEGRAMLELGAGIRFDTPRWQREVAASLLTEVMSDGKVKYSGVKACAEAVGSDVSVGVEACAQSSGEGVEGSATVLKGFFSNKENRVPVAVGGKAVVREYATEYSAIARVSVPQTPFPSRVEFEYTHISNGEILGQSFEGGEWGEIRAIVGAGAWNILGSDRREKGLSASLGYKSFKVRGIPVEQDVLVNIPDIPFGPSSRTFKIPTTGKARGEGQGVTVEVSYKF